MTTISAGAPNIFVATQFLGKLLHCPGPNRVNIDTNLLPPTIPLTDQLPLTVIRKVVDFDTAPDVAVTVTV
jgi:hypothetical protein